MAVDIIRVGIAQTDCVLGDVSANLDIAEECVRRARERDVNLLLFPELSLCGYANGPGFANAAIRVDSPHVRRLKSLSNGMAIVAGFIEETEDVEFYNSAAYVSDGEFRHVHRKVYPPNYRIFDERRWFGAGWGVWAFDTPWTRMAMLICGDAWHLTLPYMAVHDGANVLLILAASSAEGLTPDISAVDAWRRMNQSYALTLSAFVMFANRAGDESDLHFTGASHIVAPDGNVLEAAKRDEPDLIVTDLDLKALRKQRLILPFRRDDSLALTLDMGRRILRAKGQRRDGFHSESLPHPPNSRRGWPPVSESNGDPPGPESRPDAK